MKTYEVILIDDYSDLIIEAKEFKDVGDAFVFYGNEQQIVATVMKHYVIAVMEEQ